MQINFAQQIGGGIFDPGLFLLSVTGLTRKKALLLGTSFVIDGEDVFGMASQSIQRLICRGKKLGGATEGIYPGYRCQHYRFAIDQVKV